MQNYNTKYLAIVMSTLLAFVFALTANVDIALGGGESGSSNLIRPGTAPKTVKKSKTKKPKKTKKTKKKKSSRWNEDVAQTIQDHAEKDKLRYYFVSKRRMRRLLDRMYKEHEERKKQPNSSWTNKKYSFIKNKIDDIQKKYGQVSQHYYYARSIKQAFKIFIKYKEGLINKNVYENQMNVILGFVP